MPIDHNKLRSAVDALVKKVGTPPDALLEPLNEIVSAVDDAYESVKEAVYAAFDVPNDDGLPEGVTAEEFGLFYGEIELTRHEFACRSCREMGAYIGIYFPDLEWRWHYCLKPDCWEMFLRQAKEQNCEMFDLNDFYGDKIVVPEEKESMASPENQNRAGRHAQGRCKECGTELSHDDVYGQGYYCPVPGCVDVPAEDPVPVSETVRDVMTSLAQIESDEYDADPEYHADLASLRLAFALAQQDLESKAKDIRAMEVVIRYSNERAERWKNRCIEARKELEALKESIDAD